MIYLENTISGPVTELLCFTTLGLGGYLSGFTGRMVDVIGFPATFAAVTILMGATCLLAAGIRRPMARLAARASVTL